MESERILQVKIRIIFFIAVFCLLTTVSNAVADGGIAPTSGTCGENLNWTFEEGTLTITGTGSMQDYNEKTAPWNNLREQISQVIVEDGVASIGNYAFYELINLQNISLSDTIKSLGNYSFASTKISQVTLPEHLETIGYYAFSSTNLYNIEIPDTVTSIGNHVFDSCKQLTTAKLSSSLTAVPGGMFYNSALSSITIPYGVTQIGAYAFCRSQLTEIQIPDSVTNIEYHAFSACPYLTFAKLSSSLTAIQKQIFQEDSNLKTIIIYEGITAVEVNAFYKCNSLTEVYYNGTKQQARSIIINANNESFVNAKWIFCESGHTEVIIPGFAATCTEEGLSEGKYCSACETVLVAQEAIPATGHSWGEPVYQLHENHMKATAIKHCIHDPSHFEAETIETIYIVTKSPTDNGKGNVKYSAAFESAGFEPQEWNCDIPPLNTLNTLKLPSSLITINDEAFRGITCEAVIIQSTCQLIGGKAFADCKNLIYILVPKSVTNIATDAFEGSNKIIIDYGQE